MLLAPRLFKYWVLQLVTPCFPGLQKKFIMCLPWLLQQAEAVLFWTQKYHHCLSSFWSAGMRSFYINVVSHLANPEIKGEIRDTLPIYDYYYLCLRENRFNHRDNTIMVQTELSSNFGVVFSLSSMFRVGNS